MLRYSEERAWRALFVPLLSSRRSHDGDSRYGADTYGGKRARQLEMLMTVRMTMRMTMTMTTVPNLGEQESARAYSRLLMVQPRLRNWFVSAMIVILGHVESGTKSSLPIHCARGAARLLEHAAMKACPIYFPQSIRALDCLVRQWLWTRECRRCCRRSFTKLAI